MASSLDTSKSDKFDTLKAGWEKKEESALQQEMWLYFAKWEYDKWEALLKFIREKFHPGELTDKNATFEGKRNEMNADIDGIHADYEKQREGKTPDDPEYIKLQREEQEKINERMKKFFDDDINTYVTATNDSDAAKKKQIEDLQRQLHGIVVEWPKFKEYFSLERRRLVSINNRIEKLKTGKDSANYPKNVLIYLMALVETKITWWGQLLKRWWVKMARRRKSEHIKDNLKILDNKLQPKSDDSLWTKSLKEQLKVYLDDAKKAYIEKQKESVGL